MGIEITDEMLEGFDHVTASMKEVADNLKRMATTFKGSAKTVDLESKKRIKSASDFNALNKVMRSSIDEQREYNEIVAASEAVWDNMTGAVKKVSTVLADTANSLLGGEGFGMFKSMIDPLTDSFKALGKVVAAGVDGLIRIPGMIPGLESVFDGLGAAAKGAIEGLTSVAAGITNFALKLALDATDQLWKMFEGAAGAGLLVTGGLNEMHNQAKALNLTTQEYTTLMQKQTKNLTEFGGSVAGGAKKLMDVALASDQYNRRIRELGISYEEQQEIVADYMATMQRTGQLRAMTDQQIADQSFEYMKSLRVISALTGKSADEMKKDRDEALSNIAFQAKLSRMDAETRSEMQAALSAMPEGMQQAFKESVIFGKVMTDTGAIVSGVAPIIEQFANSVASGTTTSDQALQNFRDTLKEQGPALRENINSLAAAGMAELLGKGNAVTSSINKFSESLLKQLAIAEGSLQDQVEDTKNVDVGDSAENLVGMMDSQRKAMHDILDATKEQLPVMSSVMKASAEGIEKLFNEVNDMMKDPKAWARQKFDEASDATEEALGTTVSGLVDTFNTKVDELTGAITDFTNRLADDIAKGVSEGIRNALDFNIFGDEISGPSDAFSGAEKRNAERLKNMPDSPLKTQQEIQALRNKIDLLETEKLVEPPRDKYELNESGGMTRADEIDKLHELIAQLVDLQTQANNKADQLTRLTQQNQ